MFAGDANTAVKDPVVKVLDGRWHAWPCVHEIAVAADADRMHTAYCTSDDGVTWRWHGTALEGRAGHWDARGARVADVLWTGDGEALAFYDGRATAAQNWEELTGDAAGGPGRAPGHGDEPELVSPETGTGLRYLTVVALDDGACRFYFEVTRSDGAHDLRTVLAPVLTLTSPGGDRRVLAASLLAQPVGVVVTGDRRQAADVVGVVVDEDPARVARRAAAARCRWRAVPRGAARWPVATPAVGSGGRPMHPRARPAR